MTLKVAGSHSSSATTCAGVPWPPSCSIIPANRRQQAAKLTFISAFVIVFVSLANRLVNSAKNRECVASRLSRARNARSGAHHPRRRLIAVLRYDEAVEGFLRRQLLTAT